MAMIDYDDRQTINPFPLSDERTSKNPRPTILNVFIHLLSIIHFGSRKSTHSVASVVASSSMLSAKARDLSISPTNY